MKQLNDRNFIFFIYTLLFIISIIILLYLNINLSGGAKGDFYTFHLNTIQIYQNNTLNYSLLNQNSAMGPLYYILFSIFDISENLIRYINIFMFYLIGIIWIIILQNINKLFNNIYNLLLFSLVITILNPFAYATALWGNPDTLTTFLFSISILLLFKKIKYHIILSSLFFSLTVLTRQSMIAYIVFPVIIIMYKNHIFKSSLFFKTILNNVKDRNNFRELLIYIIPSTIAIIYLYITWNGLTPPSFAKHLSIGISPIFIILAYIGLFFFPLVTMDFKNYFTSSYVINSKKSIILSSIIIIYFILYATISYFHIAPPDAGGALGKLWSISEELFVILLLIGLYTLKNIFTHQNKLVIFLILIFLISFSVYDNIFYQKYIEPYFTLIVLSLMYFYKNFNKKQKSANLFILNLFLIYIMFTLLSIYQYN